MEESMRIDTVKVETDVIGMETDAVCVPQEYEPEEKIDTVTVEGVENVGEEDCIKIKTEEDYIQSVRIIKTEQENCMGFVEGETSSNSETCVTCDVDGTEEVGINFEAIYIKEEVSFKVEEAIDIKDEIPEAIPFSPIKTEHEGTVNEHHHVQSDECGYSCDMQRGEHPYSCELCIKAFIQKSTLIIHQCLHSGERPYVCDVCNKAYSYRSTLIQHKHTHSGERPYVCDICNKAYSEKSKLIQHIRAHTGERPYVCDICNKAYSEKSKLIRHIRTHTGERPYVCDICNKAYSDKSNMIRHKRTHSGERPYVCDVCNKAYSYRSDLIKHKRIHISGERQYTCEVCNRAFRQQ